jgi:hypothetical protein
VQAKQGSLTSFAVPAHSVRPFRLEFEKIYERLDIKLIEKGESFYQSMMIEIVADLAAKGLVCL